MTTVTIGGRTADTYPGFLDTEIQQSSPNATSGNADRVRTSNAVSGQERKILLQVTGLSNISGPVTVSSARLSLFRINSVASPNRGVRLVKILRAATESGASWNNYAAGLAWQTGGANGALDSEDTVLATGTIPFTGNQRFIVEGAGLTALIQDVINGVQANPWLMLEVDDPATVSGGDYDVASTQRTTESQRPFLEIVYDALSPNPGVVDDVSVSKLDGTVTVTVRIPLGAIIGGQTINYATQDGTATEPEYYTATTGSLSFAAGETEKTFTVPIIS